ncbi:MAG: restriction endonuclease [Nitrospirota bacterium]
MNDIKIPWFRYAIIAYLAKHIGEKTQFGKTALQKLIYLLQEAYNVPLGYEFKFYHYGPFSSDLLGDLDYVDYLHGVSVEFEHSLGWYFIKPGAESEKIIKKGEEFLNTFSKQIDSIIKNFRNYTAGSLELRSTLVYVSKEIEQEGKPCSDDDLLTKTKSLKPGFTDEAIKNAIDELRNKNLICKATEETCHSFF